MRKRVGVGAKMSAELEGRRESGKGREHQIGDRGAGPRNSEVEKSELYIRASLNMFSFSLSKTPQTSS